MGNTSDDRRPPTDRHRRAAPALTPALNPYLLEEVALTRSEIDRARGGP